MARHQPSPPDSPLSSMGSDDGFDDEAHEAPSAPPSRPAKRLKIKAASTSSSTAAAAAMLLDESSVGVGVGVVLPEAEEEEDEALDLSDLSSDTSGDIPSSPLNARLDEEDFQEQVTVCDWDGCPVGDIGNMDRLVEHIHNSHIENRQKKYTCEWRSCNRKGLPHASGYALKAHMRSHTREKPFYCYLPECDRSFTRSDALAKHMRTVHETEALRPSDPVPKSMQAGPSKSSKLKIIIKTPQSHSTEDGAEASAGDDLASDALTALSPELFSSSELALPVDKLYRKCYWEAKWAGRVGEALGQECRAWHDLYYKLWLEKEVLLSQVIESEVVWHERRQAIISGAAQVELGAAGEGEVEGEVEGEGEGEGEEQAAAS
ncbi:hypothetical protein CDD81_2132 [Ophiocordyceps australis]|uniref:C2H2-type domain-containing protein n=1 Tax=Ophiocordyceps australis TaxID=1399860 RepID=A0A2C5XEW3_9HYPO|nr:hypothetical protein CDD81_2132 [Ophiocordyceps australis]